MDFIQNLPEDVFGVLMDTLYERSTVSVIVLAHVSKFGYRLACKCAIKYGINRPLTCHVIAVEGLLEILKWVRSYDCYWDSFTCAVAALHGHLEVLQWARSNGCYWDSHTCSWAAHNGHLEVLQWARENGCPWNSATKILAKQKWPNVF